MNLIIGKAGCVNDVQGVGNAQAIEMAAPFQGNTAINATTNVDRSINMTHNKETSYKAHIRNRIGIVASLTVALTIGLYFTPLKAPVAAKVATSTPPTRPDTGAEITNSEDKNNMPRRFTLKGNIWGIPAGKKPQLQMLTQEGYLYRDIALNGERFTRERTHLGVTESETGQKDPDAGKAFRLQIVLIDEHVVPNRDLMKQPIPCVPISEPVTFIRRAMLPGEP